MTKKEKGFTKHIHGGAELTMDEYASYLSALSVKPFLTAVEASTLFDIGLTRIQKMMNAPDCDFTVCASGMGDHSIHRVAFDKYMMRHMLTVNKEV